jgi:hypothetical protein
VQEGCGQLAPDCVLLQIDESQFLPPVGILPTRPEVASGGQPRQGAPDGAGVKDAVSAGGPLRRDDSRIRQVPESGHGHAQLPGHISDPDQLAHIENLQQFGGLPSSLSQDSLEYLRFLK